jgi:DnaJ-class molecular chaperone
MKIRIKCPACSGHGKIKVLDDQLCPYCHGNKRVLLTHYLRTLDKPQELANVQHYQEHSSTPKPIPAA